MDKLSAIKAPIDSELNFFIERFESSLTHKDEMLGDVLQHIRQRGGKRMRPILTLLLAKNFSNINDVTIDAAIGLELLHTASLVHDDVVDESEERRGQPSVNASYNNKVAVLVGDYILSTALLYVSQTRNNRIIESLAQLGRTLSRGEILQLNNIMNTDISEDVYYDVIRMKTASLFSTCAAIGCISVGCTEEEVKAAHEFGDQIGMIFQIRDDIFDYYDSKDIGKPTGNDMMEGKLTLPAIFALSKTRNEQMLALARKVKNRAVSAEEIASLVNFSKQEGGIDYAHSVMDKLNKSADKYIESHIRNADIADALHEYLAFVSQRNW